ncbi:uncharacterized protein TNCV_2335741 [Trichonephila clavipes]|uniref:Uncharacterized protein n=1 Tax=Trichonephila clavipes TaxID=2585209 RepID=A0A8X6VNH9_TRICX|nr:uncharacterized protein TNCV_2335741 [Trichonephila clavipes]
MNLPPPPTKFSKYNHILLQATRETCEHSMAEAVREAVDENDGKGTLLLLLMVAGRSVVFFEEWFGDSHKNTGEVIDVEVFSKHCICPNKTKHLQNCKEKF